MITFRPVNIETDAAVMARLYGFTVAEPITEAAARDWWTLRRDGRGLIQGANDGHLLPDVIIPSFI